MAKIDDVDLGEGYRKLELDETIVTGDEFWLKRGERKWIRARKSVGDLPKNWSDFVFSRKLPDPQPTYRQFASAIEFYPHRNRCLRSMRNQLFDKKTFGTVKSFDDNGAHLDFTDIAAWRTYSCLFNDYLFVDDSDRVEPCGVLVDPPKQDIVINGVPGLVPVVSSLPSPKIGFWGDAPVPEKATTGVGSDDLRELRKKYVRFKQCTSERLERMATEVVDHILSDIDWLIKITGNKP